MYYYEVHSPKVPRLPFYFHLFTCMDEAPAFSVAKKQNGSFFKRP